MQKASVVNAAKGVALSALYFGSFLALWHLSLDQWYLPAGIRAACLLFLPFRFWPYVFAGDAAALYFLRIPLADKYSEQWAFLSPLLLMPMISVVPRIFRKALKRIELKERWLTLIGVATAVWSALCNTALNFGLSGPVAEISLERFLRVALGQYLGFLVLVLPLLVWLRRNDGALVPKYLSRDAAIAIGITGVMYYVTVSVPIGPELRQFLLMLMIGPSVALTLLHGWRGAAVGICLSNLAMALALPSFNFPGAHDAITYGAQQAMAITATAFFVLGSIISDHYDKVRKLGVAEKYALQIAATSYLSNERNLRDRVVALAQIQSCIDDSRQQLIRWLKDMGRYPAAMDVTRHGAIHKQIFDEHSSLLYPIRIERHGLFEVLQSPAFSNIWAGGTSVRCLLFGQPKRLSPELQVAAYRCVCNSVAMLSAGDPDRYTLKARVWRGRGQQGIVVSVKAIPISDKQRSQISAFSALELEGRIKAHGGTLRHRHANHVSFLLAESKDPESRVRPMAINY